MDRVTLALEWWADKDGNPVPFGSPLGVSVLYGIGAVVPASVAQSLDAIAGAKDVTPSEMVQKVVRAPRGRKSP